MMVKWIISKIRFFKEKKKSSKSNKKIVETHRKEENGSNNKVSKRRRKKERENHPNTHRIITFPDNYTATATGYKTTASTRQ